MAYYQKFHSTENSLGKLLHMDQEPHGGKSIAALVLIANYLGKKHPKCAFTGKCNLLSM
jgi:hypothetical protein